MLLTIVMYFVTGIITVYGVSFIHLIKAESQGYDVMGWWNEHSDELKELTPTNSLIIGWIIWPYRALIFTTKTIPWLYEQYDLKDD